MKNKNTKLIALTIILVISLVLATSFISIYLYKNHHLNFLSPFYYKVLPNDNPLLDVKDDNLALYYEITAMEPEMRVDYSNLDVFLEWQEKAYKKFRELLGSSNDGTFNKESLKVLSKEDLGEGVNRLEITYLSNDNVEIPCYLFTHDDKTIKRPGVLIVPGHGSIKQTAGLLESKNKYFNTAYNEYYQNSNAEFLAKEGFVTLTCENRGQGRLARVHPHTISANAVSIGRSYQGVILDDHISEITLLRSLKQVDKEKIGVAGVSLGGEQALYLGAVDKRISAVVSMGWLSSHEILIYPNIDVDWTIPNLLTYFDQESVASLIAPRAALYSNGAAEKDKGPGWFNSEQAIETTEEIKKSYALFDEDVEYVEHVGSHTFDNEVALEFFNAVFS